MLRVECKIQGDTIMDINKNEVFYNIKIIINKLKESNNNEEELVKEIDLLHQKLCLLLYRYNEDFNEKIKKFIRSYDRLDNVDIRKILLEKIRNNEYDSLFDD